MASEPRLRAWCFALPLTRSGCTESICGSLCQVVERSAATEVGLDRASLLIDSQQHSDLIISLLKDEYGRCFPYRTFGVA